MLINLSEYHRPQDIQETLQLLRRPQPRTVILAGGSTLVGSGDRRVEAVVDLQNLGLRYVSVDDDAGTIHMGAMSTLADISEAKELRESLSGIVAEAAHRSAGSVLRNQATLGGAVAVAAPNDELVTALLATNAWLSVYAPDLTRLSLVEFISRREELLGIPGLITEVSIVPLPGRSAAAATRVARTPADSPIVCAAAMLGWDGDSCTAARLALGGVADTPVRMEQIEATLVGKSIDESLIERAAQLVEELVHPSGDYRGSADYRRRMAGVLSRRVLMQAVAQLR